MASAPPSEAPTRIQITPNHQPYSSNAIPLPGDRAALKRFLVVLRESDMIAPAPQPPITPEDRIFAGFSNYLRQERGLTPRSIITHQPVIRRFLREVCPGDMPKSW
jgi:hypothetical protein